MFINLLKVPEGFQWQCTFLLKDVRLCCCSLFIVAYTVNNNNGRESPFWLAISQSFSCCLVIKPCPTLHDPMDQSTPGPPVFHYLLEFGQIHVGRFDDTVQPSRPLLSPSPLAFTLSQHQGLFQGVFSYHEMAKVLESQLQDLSFQVF